MYIQLGHNFSGHMVFCGDRNPITWIHPGTYINPPYEQEYPLF